MDSEDLATPGLYPLSLDAVGERVRLVPLDEAGYRVASFLDERLLSTLGMGRWAPLDALRRAMASAQAECDFIFHIGHVGSTLLSRVLGEDDRIFSVREPAILRTLATAELSRQDPAVLRDHTALFLKLWARVFRPGQRTLLKATSFVSEIGPLMMTLNRTASAILMYSPPDVHMTSILASETSRAELRINASMRLTRLHRRLDGQVWRLDALGEGERTAMSWLCETMALADLAERFADRVLRLEFDAFLAQPRTWLRAALLRLHGEAPPERLDPLSRSPHFRQYAKAEEHAFDSGTRREILARAGRDHAGEIARGMAWLEAAGAAHAQIGAALSLIEPGPRPPDL